MFGAENSVEGHASASHHPRFLPVFGRINQCRGKVAAFSPCKSFAASAWRAAAAAACLASALLSVSRPNRSRTWARDRTTTKNVNESICAAAGRPALLRRSEDFSTCSCASVLRRERQPVRPPRTVGNLLPGARGLLSRSSAVRYKSTLKPYYAISLSLSLVIRLSLYSASARSRAW